MASLSARASLPRSVGSGASTLVQSSMTSPTGSVYHYGGGGSQYSKKGSYDRDEISVIREVQIELEAPDRQDTPISSTVPEDAALQRQPFRPFTTPTSPQLASDVTAYTSEHQQFQHTAASPTLADAEDDLATWTRIPSLRLSHPHHQPSSTTIPPPNFSPYYPNISHAQVASAAGYREGATPSEERDIEKGLGVSKEREEEQEAEVGVAQSNFEENAHAHGRIGAEEDEDDEDGGEGELVDVMQMFKEERMNTSPRRVEMRAVGKGEVKKKGWLGLGLGGKR